MFVHQIVEALERNYRNIEANTAGMEKARFWRYMQEHLHTLERVKKAQHFYLGEQHDVIMHGPGKGLVGKAVLFMDSVEYLRLPYRICTFSSHKANDTFEGDDVGIDGIISTLPSNRRFAIAEQVDPETLRINLMCHMDAVAQRNNGNGWMLQQEIYFVRIGNVADAGWMNRIFPGFRSEWKQSKSKGNVFPLPLVAEKLPSIEEDMSDLTMVHIALLMLNCKNVFSERVVAPEKLNRKRRKNGKPEIFDYHVLNVVSPKKKQGYSEWAEPEAHNRVHLCRGHFKEFTAEHPLFGRYVGMYWWQPQVRGQNKKGIVMKDYRVKAVERREATPVS